MSEREEIRVHTHGDQQHSERIVVDESADARRLAYRVSSIIWVLFGLVIGLLSLRVFLKLIGVNPEAPFSVMVYSFSDLFLWPFHGLIRSPAAGGMVLEIPTIIAIIVYTFLAWVVAKIVALLIYRP